MRVDLLTAHCPKELRAMLRKIDGRLISVYSQGSAHLAWIETEPLEVEEKPKKEKKPKGDHSNGNS